MHYIYNDEDNVAMNEEPLPFTDPPENGCWNCMSFNGDYCTARWNNADLDQCDPDRDKREPDQRCEMWSLGGDHYDGSYT